MGEQADYIMDDALAADIESFDDDMDHDYDVGQPGFRAPKLITCQYCGTPGFVWKQLEDGKWRLHDRLGDNEMHECPALPQAGVDAAKLSLIRKHNRALRELVEAMDAGCLMIEHFRPDLLGRMRDLLDVRPPVNTDPAWMEPPAGYHWRDE